VRVDERLEQGLEALAMQCGVAHVPHQPAEHRDGLELRRERGQGAGVGDHALQAGGLDRGAAGLAAARAAHGVSAIAQLAPQLATAAAAADDQHARHRASVRTGARTSPRRGTKVARG
jgi:hypothetical protein